MGLSGGMDKTVGNCLLYGKRSKGPRFKTRCGCSQSTKTCTDPLHPAEPALPGLFVTTFSASLSNAGGQGSIPHWCNTFSSYGSVAYLWLDARAACLLPGFFILLFQPLCPMWEARVRFPAAATHFLVMVINVDYVWWYPRARSSSRTLAPSLFLYAYLQICEFKFHLWGCLFHIDFDYRFLLRMFIAVDSYGMHNIVNNLPNRILLY